MRDAEAEYHLEQNRYSSIHPRRTNQSELRKTRPLLSSFCLLGVRRAVQAGVKSGRGAGNQGRGPPPRTRPNPRRHQKQKPRQKPKNFCLLIPLTRVCLRQIAPGDTPAGSVKNHCCFAFLSKIKTTRRPRKQRATECKNKQAAPPPRTEKGAPQYQEETWLSLELSLSQGGPSKKATPFSSGLCEAAPFPNCSFFSLSTSRHFLLRSRFWFCYSLASEQNSFMVRKSYLLSWDKPKRAFSSFTSCFYFMFCVLFLSVFYLV
jgi:hypothetical protein